MRLTEKQLQEIKQKITHIDDWLEYSTGYTLHKNLIDTIEALQQENEQLQELAKAKADGRLKILPVKPGDIIYRPEALQFCWVITKVEIYEDEIVFIDDSDNVFRLDDIGKTVFLTKEEAQKALERSSQDGCSENNKV